MTPEPEHIAESVAGYCPHGEPYDDKDPCPDGPPRYAESVRRRYRIITPQQKNAGWLERRGDMKIRHPWDVAYRLEDGNYVVLDPALIDGETGA